MVQKWKDRVSAGDPFPRNLGKYESRNQVATNMSIGSMRIRDDLGLTCAWINGHHAHSCAQLAAINPADAKFATEMGRNLIICCADLAFQPAWFEYACGPRPPLFDPRNRTNEEMAKEMKADPLRGAPKFFNDKLSEVPAHFITPPPRRIRTPLPKMPKIPIIPRQVGEPVKQRRWIPPDAFNSYGRFARSSEESAGEEPAAVAAATPTDPEAVKAAELRARGVQWTESLYNAQKKVREQKAAAKAAAEARAVPPSPPPPRTPEPRAREQAQTPTPRRSPRNSPKTK